MRRRKQRSLYVSLHRPDPRHGRLRRRRRHPPRRLPSGDLAYVRLVGIDTPEDVRPGYPTECGARAAAASMERLAPEGAAVTLRPDSVADAERPLRPHARPRLHRRPPARDRPAAPRSGPTSTATTTSASTACLASKPPSATPVGPVAASGVAAAATSTPPSPGLRTKARKLDQDPSTRVTFPVSDGGVREMSDMIDRARAMLEARLREIESEARSLENALRSLGEGGTTGTVKPRPKRRRRKATPSAKATATSTKASKRPKPAKPSVARQTHETRSSGPARRSVPRRRQGESWSNCFGAREGDWYLRKPGKHPRRPPPQKRCRDKARQGLPPRQKADRPEIGAANRT